MMEHDVEAPSDLYSEAAGDQLVPTIISRHTMSPTRGRDVPHSWWRGRSPPAGSRGGAPTRSRRTAW